MADRLLADSGNPPPRVFRLLLSSPPSWVLHSVTINCRSNISSQGPRPTLLQVGRGTRLQYIHLEGAGGSHLHAGDVVKGH